MMISRKQQCHDLALEYARIKTLEQKNNDNVMCGVEETDQLLIYYTYAYNRMYDNYLQILQRHEDRKKQFQD